MKTPTITAKFTSIGFPAWYKDNCIQCNQRAYICPHAAIRPFVLTDDELAKFDSMETLEMKAPAAMKGMHFVVEPSVLDCLGCGNCADICPSNPKLGKALTMVPFNPDTADMKKMAADWDKLYEVVDEGLELLANGTALGSALSDALAQLRSNLLGLVGVVLVGDLPLSKSLVLVAGVAVDHLLE